MQIIETTDRLEQIEEDNFKYRKLWEEVNSNSIYSSLLEQVNKKKLIKSKFIRPTINFKLDEDFEPEFFDIGLNTNIAIRPDKMLVDVETDNLDMVKEFTQSIEIQVQRELVE